MEQDFIVGLRFHPTDHELVYIFLRKKLNGVLTDCEDIPEIKIYDHEPFDLPRDCSMKRLVDDVFYFFSVPNYMGLKRQRCKRTTRAGFWKITGDPRVVKHKITKKEIGKKTSLVFHLGRGKGTPTEWVMHEYKYTENIGQGDFVLCKIKKKFNWKSRKSKKLDRTSRKSKKFDRKSRKNGSSFNTPASLTDQNEDCLLMTPSGSDKSKSSFDVVSPNSNQIVGDLPITPEMTEESGSSFHTLIPAVNQIEASNVVASLLERELGYNTSTSPNHFVVSPNKSQPSCFNIDISPDFRNGDQHRIVVTSPHKSGSSFDTPIFAVDEMDPDHPVVLCNKGELSFSTNTSSDFHNGDENQIMANAAIYGNEVSYPVASANKAKPSFGFTNQNMMIADSALPYENSSAIYRNEDNYATPSDLGNHMPDRSPSFSCDSAYFHPLDFDAWTNQAICSKENQMPDHELGDCPYFNFEDLVNYNFQEEITQEGDSSQLLLSSTDFEYPETTMNKDFNEDQLMCSDVPTMGSGSSILAELDAFF